MGIVLIIADLIKEDTTVYFLQHDQQQFQKVAQKSQHELTQQTQDCNHGCHIAFHLLGFAEARTTNFFAFNESQTVFTYANHLLENPLLQGPYRPPLTLS